MYVPGAFQMTDVDASELAQRGAVGHLITGADGRPESTMIPFTLATVDGRLVLRAHLARANPHHRLLAPGAEALVVVQGPDAYVSPGLYPSKSEHGKVVPTWNYALVHLRGTLQPVGDGELPGLVGDLTDLHEQVRDEPWAVSDAPTDFITAQLRAIVGIEMTITSIEGKAKLSQNRPEADHDAVRQAFGRGTAREQAVAQLMR
ncbi:MAG: FMN-binding negative transcriptional regulator [Ilumatobacteraceae bacterium]